MILQTQDLQKLQSNWFIIYLWLTCDKLGQSYRKHSYSMGYVYGNAKEHLKDHLKHLEVWFSKPNANCAVGTTVLRHLIQDV